MLRRENSLDIYPFPDQDIHKMRPITGFGHLVTNDSGVVAEHSHSLAFNQGNVFIETLIA